MITGANINQWSKAEPITHDRLNEMVDAINALQLTVGSMLDNSMRATPIRVVAVKAGPPVSGQRGRYDGFVLRSLADANATGDLIEDDITGEWPKTIDQSEQGYDTVIWNLSEISDEGFLEEDAIYLGLAMGMNSLGKLVVAVNGGIRLIDFGMTKTSGSAGTASAACSFKYNLYSTVDNSLLNTYETDPQADGKWKRPSVGAMKEANYGIGRRVTSGGSSFIQVIWCNEVQDVEACT